MNELIIFLQELATKIPGSKRANDFIKSKPHHLQDIISSNQSTVIKQSLSNTELYADMTQITSY